METLGSYDFRFAYGHEESQRFPGHEARISGHEAGICWFLQDIMASRDREDETKRSIGNSEFLVKKGSKYVSQ